MKALLEASFTRFATLPAFTNRGTTLTYGEVERLSRAFAAYLQSIPGLTPGERVAVMLPNLLQYPVVAFAILRAGLIVVNVNPLYTARELEQQLTDSGARAVVVLENFAHTLEKGLAGTAVRTVIVTEIGDHFPWVKRLVTNFVVRRVMRLIPPWRISGAIRYSEAISAGRSMRYSDVPVGGSDVALLQYTGGTTGVAKGAMLTHRNMVSNVLQAVAWARPFIRGPGDVVVTALPLYHIFSLTANLFAFVELGGRNLLITNPRDLPAFVAELKRGPFTYITGVNTLFNALLHTPGFEAVDFSELKVSMGGGMAVQKAVAEAWQRVTGVPLAQGYGLTETSPIVCANPLDGQAFNGSVGLPLPSTEVGIVAEDGRWLEHGEPGEICVRGPQVMAGYWRRPEETEQVLSADGWLKTGDIGHMDARGFVFIEDRKKDLIKVSGFNVYPNEIEDVVAEHPGVREVAAIGVSSEHSGEAVKLFVVRKDPSLTAAELLDFCRERLTAYKIPRVVEFRDELPKTQVGKILRRALKDTSTEEGLDGSTAAAGAISQELATTRK
jgi:long-chain acyl-CoA synthetase